MSCPTPKNRRLREVEMREQEQIILKKREILERQQSKGGPVPDEAAKSPVLPFKNDGTFLENFKKLTQAASFIEQLSQPMGASKDPEDASEVLSDNIPNTVQELVADRFLFDLNSPAHRSSRQQGEAVRKLAKTPTIAQAGTSKAEAVDASGNYGQFLSERRGMCYREEDDDTEDSDTEYRREAKERNLKNIKNRLVWHYDDSDSSSSDQHEQPKYEGSRFNQENFPTHAKPKSGQEKVSAQDTASVAISNKKKRKSRWDSKAATSTVTAVDSTKSGEASNQQPLEKKSKLDRSNPELIKLAISSFNTVNLDEEQWAKVEEQFQIKQVYNDLLAKKAEREKLAQTGRYKFEYDSDEDVDGGTWEHKLRKAEMDATRDKADTLTAINSGRHHIGDFLPPDELKKFMEQHDKKRRKTNEPLTDYQDKKLTEENKGFQMLQKLGWKDGEGLGASGSGIVNPINKAPSRDANQGLGITSAINPENDDNEYDAYRKRMMLAYRFRPNPMNNPRRSYY